MFTKKHQLLKKVITKIVLLVLTAFFTISISSCQKQIPLPDDVTPDYFYENYDTHMPNLYPTKPNIAVVAECRGEEYTGLENGFIRYRRIKKTDPNIFIDCIVGCSGFFQGPVGQYVLRHKDSDVDPINDWTVKSISIYIDDKKVEEIKDYHVITEILNCATGHDYEISQTINRTSSEDLIPLYADYSLHIRFEESDGIEWRTQVNRTDEGFWLHTEYQYNIEHIHYAGTYGQQGGPTSDLFMNDYGGYIYVGKHFDSFMQDIVKEHG